VIDLDPLTVATIFAMALATYVAKAGGMWVLDRIEISERTEAGLEALPGGIIVAILAPRLVDGDPATWVAAGVWFSWSRTRLRTCSCRSSWGS